MINLNKKQVGALLKFMPKDGMRESLEALHIEEHKGQHYAVATNGFILTALLLDTEDAQAIEGTFIRRDALERWYKLATGKDRLTTQELAKVSADDFAHHNGYLNAEYPNWRHVVPEQGITEATEKIGFNSDYMKAVTDLADKQLLYELHGSLGAITAHDEGNVYVIMPLRK